MTLAISHETTVGALLEAYPEAEDVLIGMAPAFAKLRNPLVRRSVAKFATLNRAARIGGVRLDEMIRKLRDFIGQGGLDLPRETADAPSEGESWLTRGRAIGQIDADAMLERGVHPIGKVRELSEKLRAGEVIVLRSSFRPQPLIGTMRRSGVEVYSVTEGDAHVTYFGSGS